MLMMFMLIFSPTIFKKLENTRRYKMYVVIKEFLHFSEKIEIRLLL